MSENGEQLDTIEVSPGDTVAICRCGESDAYPLCDGTHQKLDNIRPAVVKVIEE